MAVNSARVQSAQKAMVEIFKAQRALQALAPEFRWKGLGNLLGDFGELICIEHYGLQKAPASTNGFDAWDREGRTVQIKARCDSGQIDFRGRADVLLVIEIASDASWEEAYFGQFGHAGIRCRALAKRQSASQQLHDQTAFPWSRT